MPASRSIQDPDPLDAAQWPEPTFDALLQGYGRHRGSGENAMRGGGRNGWLRRRSAARPRRAVDPTGGAAR